RARAVRSGYAIRGRPHREWRTLGCRERIRLPSPAARMTAVTWFIGYGTFYPGPPGSQSGFPPERARGPALTAVAQMQQKPLDSRRNRRGALDHFPESGMHEREPRGVQRVAVELHRRARARLSVNVVADDRMAQRRQVHADLVGATGLEADFQYREMGE